MKLYLEHELALMFGAPRAAAAGSLNFGAIRLEYLLPHLSNIYFFIFLSLFS